MKKITQSLLDNDQDDIEIPNGYECPITRTLMEDPVITPDGHSYERKAIEQWFQTGNRSSPITGMQLPDILLTPNHNLKKAIEDFSKLYSRLETIKQMELALSVKEAKLRDKEKELHHQESELRKRKRTLESSKQISDEIKPSPAKKQTVPAASSLTPPEPQDTFALYQQGEKYFFLNHYTKALPFLLQAAELKYPPTFLRLGYIYAFGYEYGLQDQKKSKTYYEIASQYLNWFQSGAEQKDADRQYYLGICYDHGIGVIKSAYEAAHWYQLAAEQKHVPAQIKLIICYRNGRGVSKDIKEAVRLSTALAHQGYAVAQFELAMRYACGSGVEKNQSEAVNWFRLAAIEGHITAQYELGKYYEDGIGIPKDEKEAVKWYRLAANAGHARAQLCLASCHEMGMGVREDPAKALYWHQVYETRNRQAAPQNSRAALLLAEHPGLEPRPPSPLTGAQHRFLPPPDTKTASSQSQPISLSTLPTSAV